MEPAANASHLYQIANWAALAAIIVYAVLFNLVILRLRKAHPETWDRLGQPTPLIRSPKAGWALTSFIFSGKHRALDDVRISVLVMASRVALVLFIGLVLWRWILAV